MPAPHDDPKQYGLWPSGRIVSVSSAEWPAFLRIAKTLYRLVFAQFRTENRFPLFLELL